MRDKITVQEKIETGKDSLGRAVYAWRDCFSAWAGSDADGNMTIKARNDVKRGMQVVWNSRILTIGHVAEVNDGGVRLLKLTFNSARGDFARARSAPKAPAALPTTQDEDRDER